MGDLNIVTIQVQFLRSIERIHKLDFFLTLGLKYMTVSFIHELILLYNSCLFKNTLVI